MSLTPHFSDALTSHFAASGDSTRASNSSAPPTSPVAFSRQPLESPASAESSSAGSTSAVGENGMPSTDRPSTDRPSTDRRQRSTSARASRAGMERRQFGSSHSGLSAEGRDLAAAIDAYKLEHRRRYITCDEMLVVLKSLGYDKTLASEETR